jgi:hypothetical protein
MEKSLCTIELMKNPREYLAKVQSDIGGIREYKSESFEEVLEQVVIDVQEEYESHEE